jgi:hypothetical protein
LEKPSHQPANQQLFHWLEIENQFFEGVPLPIPKIDNNNSIWGGGTTSSNEMVVVVICEMDCFEIGRQKSSKRDWSGWK